MTPAMLSADYWIARQPNPDQRILSPEEIETKSLPAASRLSFPDLQSPETRWGICCAESGIFYHPTRKQTKDEEDPWSDENRFSGILVNEPVWILETSADGQWFRIRTCFGSGWVQRRFIAECRSRREWLDAQDPEALFLIVTAGRLTLLPQRTAPQKEPASYRMGTCLRLIPALQAPKTIDGRFYLDNYVVRIPARDPDGFLSWDYQLIPVSADVHIGFLPYTRRQLLCQIFKLQGDIYGWGDMYRSHDCSSYAMAVYRCFGFRLARDSSDQARMPFPSIDLKGLKPAEKKAALRRSAPGSLLWFQGHIMLYLGWQDDRYYSISAAGRCCLHSGEPAVSAGTAFLCELGSICRKNGRSWLSELQKVLEPR